MEIQVSIGFLPSYIKAGNKEVIGFIPGYK